MEHIGSHRQETPVYCYCNQDRDLPPGICYGPVIRDVYIIECNTGGYGSVIINGKTFPVRPGDCYILLPGDTVTHTADHKDPRQGVWCAIDGMQVGWALAQAGITSETPYAPSELFTALTEQVDLLVQMRNDTDPGTSLRRLGCIYTFLGILLRTSHQQSKTDWLRRVMGYMDANYYLPICVSDLAREACMERSYFSVQFKRLVGQTPHAYLTALRVRKACTLMDKTSCPTGKAAELVGLDNRNFARLFKKETGMTPRQYLQKNMSPSATNRMK